MEHDLIDNRMARKQDGRQDVPYTRCKFTNKLGLRPVFLAELLMHIKH